MKIEIREILDEKSIRITTPDERWYKKDGDTFWRPSSTWIAEYYPKGIGFYKWIGDKGWDEAQAIKEAAGDKGSRVHHGIDALLSGAEINLDDHFPDSNGEQGELSVEEWECLISFYDWFKETKPNVLHREKTVFNDKENYAGTLDLIAHIQAEPWLIDFKTSQTIWPSHEIQISSYKHADRVEAERLAILQIGYRRNKKGWKFTEIPDKFDLFLAAKLIWAQENADKQPFQKDYPRSLSL